MTDILIGSDEVGYGAWAGPLYVCAVAQSKSYLGPPGLTDSKKLSIEQRAFLYPELQNLPCALISMSNEYIDRVGVKRALLEAHTTAVRMMLKRFPGADVIVDGVLQLPDIPKARAVPKADALFPVVSAASNIAKFNRDWYMVEQHKLYPDYGFDTGVGYGTKKHEEGLERLGPCPLHRRSYAPIKKYIHLKENRHAD